jgi:hypothetical protein
MGDGSWFLYRSPYQGPSPTLVRRLPDRTPLAWFQRVWSATADTERIDDEAGAHDWVARHLGAELGVEPYGLAWLFASGRWTNPEPAWNQDRDGPFPATTWRELRDLLRRYLYVEGPPDEQVQVDEHSVRAKTDDDEADLAYFFLDDAIVRTAPDRVAYLMLGDWRLPVTTTPGASGFEAPVPVRTLAGAGSGTGTTWLVGLDTSRGFEETPPVAFAGVRLPGLAGLLRTTLPGPTGPCRKDLDRWSGWPPEPLALRALVAPGDRSIGAALRRYNHLAWPLDTREAVEALYRSAEEPHTTAHARLVRVLSELQSGPRTESHWRNPALSRIQVTSHLVQAAVHVDQHFSYERWYLFDDVWAAAHPDLAASLLRCATGWDPFRD